MAKNISAVLTYEDGSTVFKVDPESERIVDVDLQQAVDPQFMVVSAQFTPKATVEYYVGMGPADNRAGGNFSLPCILDGTKQSNVFFQATPLKVTGIQDYFAPATRLPRWLRIKV